MYVDTQTEFSDAQAVTSTAISSNVMDLFTVDSAGGTAAANTRIDIGSGTGDLYLVVQTQTTVTDTSSDATLVVTLESADDAGLSTNAQVHYSTGTLAFATYASAGTIVAAVRLPAGLYRRYLGLRYTVASGPFLTGKFDAFLTPTLQLARIYKSGFTVQ